MIPDNMLMSQSDDFTVTALWNMRLQMHTRDTYRGRLLCKFPEDLRTYQHVIEDSAPEVIVELGSQDGGSAQWFADQLQTFFGKGEVISVDTAPVRPLDRPDITFIQGDLTSPEVIDKVFAQVGDRSCMVVEDSAHTYPVTLAALELYSDLVQGSTWFVVEDGVVDEDHLRLSGWPRGVQQAVTEFCASERGQRFNRLSLTPYGLTCHHDGWLRPIQ